MEIHCRKPKLGTMQRWADHGETIPSGYIYIAVFGSMVQGTTQKTGAGKIVSARIPESHL